MFNSKEMHEKMRECLGEMDEFSTDEMRNMLSRRGCRYNIDYQANAFSNALAFLAKKNVIEKYGEKGHYRVVSQGRAAEVMEAEVGTGTGETGASVRETEAVDTPVSSDRDPAMDLVQGTDSKTNDSMETGMDGDKGEELEKKELGEEVNACGFQTELNEFRDKIIKCLEKDYLEIKQIIDAEKTTLILGDRDTLEDTVRLLKFLGGFRFRGER